MKLPDSHGAARLIKHYNLIPLEPEGGWYQRIWYKKGEISQIYYLLTEYDFSEFHVLPYQEQIIFLSGDSVEHYQGALNGGTLSKVILGEDFRKGEVRDILVEARNCQALRLVEGGKWALMTTIMSPPYETEDYRSLGFDEMAEAFPNQGTLLKELTRF